MNVVEAYVVQHVLHDRGGMSSLVWFLIDGAPLNLAKAVSGLYQS